MINLVCNKIVFKNNSPFFKAEYNTPSDKKCVLLNDNTLRVNKGSALDDFIKEREEIIKEIQGIKDRTIKEKNLSEDTKEDNEIKDLEDKLEEVDNLISTYEKGCLINFTDQGVEHKKSDGVNLRA